MALNERVFEVVAARSGVAGPQAGTLETLRELQDVPVLSETLLRVELMVRERSVDLREISTVVLSDLGATLQIMRLAGREDAFEDGRVPRIEDCISGLGVQACLEAIARRPLKPSTRPPAVIDTWAHARIIAENCKFLAEETSSFLVNPDEAYLVGLFHELGTLPAILGWNRSFAVPADPAVAGLRMAQAWSLPACVAEYFSELRSHAAGHRWSAVVEQAHPDAQYAPSTAAPGDHRPMQTRSAVSLQLA
ncbi:MAG: HDOD domain-containing protein [Terracidiphilus sp.]